METTDNNRPELSVIVPVYKNRDTLNELQERLHRVLDKQMISFETVFVDDACPEGSSRVLEEIAATDQAVTVIKLKRNVGQSRSILLGLSHCRGSRAAVLDADLQDPPEALPAMLAKIAEGFAAVFAGRRGKYQSLTRLTSSIIFKGLQRLVSGVPIDSGQYLVMDRRMINYLIEFDQEHIISMIGFSGRPSTSIPVKRSKRESGRSAYNYKKRLLKGYRTISWSIKWRWFPALGGASPDNSDLIERIINGKSISDRSIVN